MQEINEERLVNNEPVIAKKKIKLLCETRWIERHTALEEFQEMHTAVVSCLDSIVSGRNTNCTWDSRTVADGNGLNKSITSPAFIAAFQTVRYLFGFTKSLSVLLQGSSKDVLTAYNEINLVSEELTFIRANVERDFQPVFQQMSSMATSCDQGELTIPRRCGRQTQRNNVEADCPEEYWRRSTFVLFLDYLIAELSTRFGEVASTAVLGLSLIPAHLSDLTDELSSKLYSSYLPDMPSPSTFHHELRLWKRKWETVEEQGVIPSNLQDTLSDTNRLLFPVTNAQVERSNSSFKYIKTPLRSTMGADRLNALILMYVHKDIPLDHNRIIDMFASRHQRLMLLVNPMSD